MIAILLAVGMAPDLWQGHVQDFKTDPVALVRDGKDLQGTHQFTLQREGFKYHFIDQNNLAEFKAMPTRYEIQLGGACGKMGALSGRGATSIYAVAGGRLYMFASQSCKQTFMENNDKMLEFDYAPPRVTEAADKKGKELAAKMLRWTGDPTNIGPVMRERKYDYRTTDHVDKVVEQFAWNFPHGYARSDSYEGAAFGHVLGEQNVFTSNGKADKPMAAQQKRAAERERNASYIAGIYAVANGGTLFGDGDLLSVYHNGTIVTYELNERGVVAAMTSMMRHGMEFVEVTHTYTSWHDYKGMHLPGGWTIAIDGNIVETVSDVTWREADMSLFKP